MKHFLLLHPVLGLFDDGASAAPAPAGDGAQAGLQALPGNSRRGKTGGLAKVVYGKQSGQSPAGSGSDAGSVEEAARGEQAQRDDTGGDRAPAAEESQNPSQDRQAQFRALVDGEYKDQFAKEVQRIIDRRFKETRGLQESLEAQRPILDLLAQRYQVQEGDPAKLLQAIEADDAYWSQAAEEAGMSVEQYKQFQKLQRENEAFRRVQQARQGEQAAQRQLQQWYAQAEAMRERYPQFDLEAETKNPQFLSMLRSGIPVQHAYEVLHLDDIKGGLARAVAQTTEKRVAASVQANGVRPVENGISSQSGITIKSDVSKLTSKDRAEIARRAARGESIAF